MKRRVLAALLWAGLAFPVPAQPSTLTIRLREDPDGLIRLRGVTLGP